MADGLELGSALALENKIPGTFRGLAEGYAQGKATQFRREQLQAAADAKAEARKQAFRSKITYKGDFKTDRYRKQADEVYANMVEKAEARYNSGDVGGSYDELDRGRMQLAEIKAYDISQFNALKDPKVKKMFLDGEKAHPEGGIQYILDKQALEERPERAYQNEEGVLETVKMETYDNPTRFYKDIATSLSKGAFVPTGKHIAGKPEIVLDVNSKEYNDDIEAKVTNLVNTDKKFVTTVMDSDEYGKKVLAKKKELGESRLNEEQIRNIVKEVGVEASKNEAVRIHKVATPKGSSDNTFEMTDGSWKPNATSKFVMRPNPQGGGFMIGTTSKDDSKPEFTGIAENSGLSFKKGESANTKGMINPSIKYENGKFIAYGDVPNVDPILPPIYKEVSISPVTAQTVLELTKSQLKTKFGYVPGKEKTKTATKPSAPRPK